MKGSLNYTRYEESEKKEKNLDSWMMAIDLDMWLLKIYDISRLYCHLEEHPET